MIGEILGYAVVLIAVLALALAGDGLRLLYSRTTNRKENR